MSTPRRYFVQTFGCRVNQADSAEIGALLDGGNVRVDTVEEADVVVLNTCTVTHRADADVRKAVRRIKREKPDADVVVTGCYAQREPEAVAALSGVNAVLGNAFKSRLPVVVEQLQQEPGVQVVFHSDIGSADPRDLPPVNPVTTVMDRTRPFVKIQDGCDAHCTYCIIPEVRGPANSASTDRVAQAVSDLVNDGWVEIVLAGVHLGTYQDQAGNSLTNLVQRVLQTEDLIRLRLSCIEPMAFPMELVDLAASDPRLCPHFHLPLQSGSDDVLKRMVRPYRGDDYVALCREIRARVPDVCLGTDVIVGFPGETDADFADTYRVIEEAGIDYLHVFSYSDREGTPATRLTPKIGSQAIKDRSRSLIELGKKRWQSYLDRQLGRTLKAVTLEGHRALSNNFCPIELDEEHPANRDVELSITGRSGDVLQASFTH